MTDKSESTDSLLHSLRERTKELNCLYEADELLSARDRPQEITLRRLAAVMPEGWQYSDVCHAVLTVDGRRYAASLHDPTPWVQRAEIMVDGESVGDISVYYREQRPAASEGPFLREERRLINAIAERVALYLQRKSIRTAQDSLATALKSADRRGPSEWAIVLDFLRRADPPLFATITRKMINYLCWNGVEEAIELLREYLSDDLAESEVSSDLNRPAAKSSPHDIAPQAVRAFRIASQYCSDEEIVVQIRSWIEEDKAAGLVETLENSKYGFAEVAVSLDRFLAAGPDDPEVPQPLKLSLGASLIRRFFTHDLGLIGILKDRVTVRDFHSLIRRVVYTSSSRGHLGGKSTGLFLGSVLLRDAASDRPDFAAIRIPKTWYVTSDGVLEFIRHNNLDDVHSHKYQDIERVRRDYPHLMSVFKNSPFPNELLNGIAAALDDLGDQPLIVRSSSLLEDQIGAAFSGKYKSLFLANQGTKPERLAALIDAVAEVYASIFAPDPIEYRSERGLLDVNEEMAVMIQEVVGVTVGDYFFPAYSGVAFSRNDFRWSPRIRREDGLLRLVPGLGTRAVDRTGDDYPVLVAPGQPGLRVNVSADEVVRYSPRKIDVINLATNSFQTIDVEGLLREVRDEYPQVRQIVSIVSEDRVRRPVGLEPDWDTDRVAVTFAGVIEDQDLTKTIRELLNYLCDELGHPVDIEFASDGKHLYLLQCRAQSLSEDFEPAPIPRHISPDDIVFTANRYVSNGRVPDITHIVYVDPAAYAELESLSDLKAVARVVGRLNKILPHRQFMLIGPGRWGSRGDIKLGVGVTYADINNTAALLEVAWKHGNYAPELSFGTHFFQDLVEADIRYLPLYPDEPGIVFNRGFLTDTPSLLAELVPEFEYLDNVVRVVDVANTTGGRVLKLLLNADLGEAVAMLAAPSGAAGLAQSSNFSVKEMSEEHWRWRLLMSEKIAESLDPGRFGVHALYVIGSAKNATAGPSSDLDLVVHFRGDEGQRERLELWLDGWSRSLAEVNYLRTGYRTDHLLDVHFVTDDDIREKTSFASKIGAVTDSARPLPMGGTATKS